MIRLTKSQVLLIHDQLIAETGGSSGLRDEGILDSALSAPFQTFGGEDVYPSLQQKAARLCFGLVKNHPFVDGNKRIGAHVMLVFLALNGVELQHSQTELSDIILQLAAGEINAEHLLRWILSHQV
ncbi:MAG TPA: type II toxin-antitoxin system death-on-curing family toxin [Candidatus Mediterraneibacter avicola]|jgi:death-on-curing protein|nr:type II toxin-antitoxin system death-on-curing family toxin [Candidatus Mediterraneibacter avicola]